MTRIVNRITIDAPIERVFDYATTPAHWPDWHPTSRSVKGAIDHSLEVGEQLIEDIEDHGRRWQARWVVRSRAVPHLWVIEGNAEGGNATLTYRLSACAGGTEFERELVYTMGTVLWRLLDITVVHRRMAEHSAEALRRLKALLEQKAGRLD